jgi:arylsulfatase A-like enzyme
VFALAVIPHGTPAQQVGDLTIAPPPGPTAAAARPNLILILADDLGYEVLGSNGGTSYRTPNLDRVAAEGMRFERAYVTPLCTPTRVHLMTGKYNFRNYERFGYMNPRERTFANMLRDAGYATAIAGKWQLRGDEQTPHHFGFDEYLLWQLRGPDYWTRYKDPVVTRSGAGTDTLRGRYGPDVFLEFIEDFIERHRDRPFLVYYPMVLTHDPFQPPPDHPDFRDYRIEGTNNPTYFPAMVSYMDRIIGRLVGRLDELGLRANTLILFLGDNGTDRDVTSRMGERVVRGDKGYTTDAGTHVPLIANWKGVINPGQVRGELVDMGDFLPTLLDAAGIRPGPDFAPDGMSFYPTLRTGAVHPRRWIFRDYDPRWGRLPARRYAQDTSYKLYDDGRLYDYVRDPLEQSPLKAEGLPKEASRAKAALQDVLDRMRAEIRTAGPADRRTR